MDHVNWFELGSSADEFEISAKKDRAEKKKKRKKRYLRNFFFPEFQIALTRECSILSSISIVITVAVFS